MAAAARPDGGTKRRRKDVQEGAGVAEDRISALPEALQLHVLGLLPLKSAIRTGALSTRWRSLWTRRWPAPSSLDFSLGTHDSPLPLLETLERRGRQRLERFALSFRIGELKAEHFHRCLDYAAACAVEDLHVHLANQVFAIFFQFTLPLGGPHLARLSLRGISVDLPFSFSAGSHTFSALEVIRLHCVRISQHTVRRLVAACPLLGTLDLRYCEGLDYVCVAAAGAHLRSLTVAECDRLTDVFAGQASGLRSFRYSGAYIPAHSIPATTTLADIYICFGGPANHRRHFSDTMIWFDEQGPDVRRNNWLDLLTNLSNLTVLTLCSSALRRLSTRAHARSVARNVSPCKLQNLRELQLLMFTMTDSNMSDIYIFLMTCCSPQLERLFVQLPTMSNQFEPEEEPSGSESEEDRPVEELSEQALMEEDELEDEMSEGDGPEEELPEGEAPEEYELEEELSEGEAPEEEFSKGDAPKEDELEEELSEEEAPEEEELEEEFSKGDAPKEDEQSKGHGSKEELSDEEQLEEETRADGFVNLTLLNVMNFKGHHNEMRLVSLVLKKSTSLNQLLLFIPKSNQAEGPEKNHMNASHFLERKLLPLRKASTNAQIIVSEPDDSAIQPLHHEVFVQL